MGCRPIICLDGCHLKSSVGGILLSAVGIDAKNCIYPFAYAVVEKDKKKSWLWFLEMLVQDLNITHSYGWTIMSDKQKGLIDAVDQLLPGCEHRFCVMHLYKNFKNTHKGMALKDILWRAARATKMADFEGAMNDMRTRNTAAYEWLMQRPATHWSKSHFSTHWRPKKHARKKDPDEVKDKEKHVKKSGKLGKKGVTMKCSLCHQPNHNARGCQLNKKSTEESMDVPAADPDRRSNVKKGRKRKTPTPEKEPDVISPTRVTSTSRSNIVTSPTRVTRSSTMTSPTRVTRSSTMTSPTRVTRVNAMKKSEKPKKVNFVPPRLTRSTANPIVEVKDKATKKGKAKIIENPRKKLEVRKNLLIHTKGKSVATEATQATTKEGTDAMILTQSSINNSLLRPLWRPTGSNTSNSTRFSMFKGTQTFDKIATTSEEEETPVCRQ
ncbi:UNVERIFIED_CONTAM: hypothetical protein Sradi_6577900 [Sesamum radiatum]|uniref:MULE transposase domain-containing protein n=1 Tax=Sesamum radiatum TaxID=300843 RepID=A0AAW2JXU3_SESRA